MNDKLEFPQLETERLFLRKLMHDHIDAVFSLFSDAEVTRYEDAHPVRNRGEVKQIIDWGNSKL